jgi:predicted phage terminase large subunit-like protein
MSPARFKVVNCGRRFGKTMMCLIAVLIGHGPNRELKGALYGANIWWVAPTDKIARKIWRDLKRSLRTWGGELAKNEVEHRIEFPGGGSIEVRSAHDPEALRGDGLNGVVIDEAAFTHPDTWATLRPAIADLEGWAIFISTPNGTDNWFFEEWKAAAEAADYERWQRPTSDNPTISAKEIAAMRSRMGEARFARECLAEFHAGEGGVFDIAKLKHYDRIGDKLWFGTAADDSADVALYTRFGTVDTAATVKRSADYTVISSWAHVDGRGLVLLDVVRRKLKGAELVDAMAEAVDKHDLTTLYVERESHNTLFIDLARTTGDLPIRELEADKDKRTRAEPAAAAMERGQIWVPRSARWLQDWKDEVAAFDPPRSPEKDDQVDTLSYAAAVVFGDMGVSGLPAFR